MLFQLAEGATEYGMLLISLDERILYWNEGACRLFGFTKAEIVGHPFSTIFTEEDQQLGVSGKELEKARAQGWAEDERWHQAKTGDRFWGSGIVTALMDENGELTGYSKILRNMTVRKETEDRLLSELSEQTHFNRVLSHDLHEPLRVVRAYLGLIRKKLSAGAGASAVLEFLEFAEDGTQRMQALLMDLLSYVQLDRKLRRMERADASALCDMAIANLNLLIHENDALVTRIGLPVVQAYPTLVTQLFQNLIANGIRYRQADVRPLILIEADSENDEWVFSVSDNGIGISPEAQKRAFVAFERMEAGNDRPGTGLGLFICKRIVERHGGRIWLESEVGRGTAVKFTLKCHSLDEPTCKQQREAERE
jgi:PAS domain S-box-containing protein